MKKCFMYIDDVIFVLRDIARQKPASIYDHPFMTMLKSAHDLYGIKIQLNTFCRTDFFYGSDEFTLADMPEDYKAEWTEASNWLKFGFHAKQEFPDYPYVNARYEDLIIDFGYFKSEVSRFACEDSVALGIVPHWNTMSKDGCRALASLGVKLIHATSGIVHEYNGDPTSLPYGHSFRLIHNRQPETKCYSRGSRNKAIDSSLCGYNHINELKQNSGGKFQSVKFDKETGLSFKDFGNGPILNLYNPDELEDTFAPLMNDEYVSIGNHEQYFYKDYFAYQPEYADKLLTAARIMCENGFEFIFIQQLAEVPSVRKKKQFLSV